MPDVPYITPQERRRQAAARRRAQATAATAVVAQLTGPDEVARLLADDTPPEPTR